MNKATCIITNCRGRAPSDEPFCAKHRDTPVRTPSDDASAWEWTEFRLTVDPILRAFRKKVRGETIGDPPLCTPVARELFSALVKADAILAALPTTDGAEPLTITETIKAALEKWRALPDDERNGERPFIHGFNAGWDEAVEQGMTTDASERMREAVLTVLDAVRDYLPPDSISAHDCLTRVIGAVDNPEINPIIRTMEAR